MATVSSSSAALLTGPTADTSYAASGDDFRSKTYLLKNNTSTATVWLRNNADGAATTSATTSYPWAAGDAPLIITLEPGEIINAISGGADQTIAILNTGR
jgi:hypothetical protein